MEKGPPYLSVVISGRNDDHGKNFLERTQVFLDSLHSQVNRARVNTEIVLVEWNPPPDRPSLQSAINWPDKSEFCSIRIIQVPAEIHHKIKYSDVLPLFQMRAKNVGIRRASGHFVLATNPDILFSNQLISYIGKRRLLEHRTYRVDRIDIQPDLRALHSVGNLHYCWTHKLRIHARYRSHVLTQKQSRLLALYELWQDWRRFKIKRDIHTNACGDFTLIANKDWQSLRGYPELDVMSTHVDSLLCFLAHYGPAQEKFLSSPRVIFHIEHERADGDTIDLFSTDPSARIPALRSDEAFGYAERLKKGEKIIFNDEKWGLSEEDLPEKLIHH